MNGLLLSAFTLGLLGSLHCLGMCGPLALSMPVDSSRNTSIQLFIYHSGRSLSYGLIGFMAGTMGWGIKWVGWQQGLTIGTGLLLILLVVFPRIFGKMHWGHWNKWLLRKMEHLWQDMHNGKRFLLGVFNGLLPCGFVYMALSGALVTAIPTDSALFMIFFGLGTWPMMWSVQWFGGKLWAFGWRKKWNTWAPMFTIMVGCVLILRGLGLGIPVLSPSFQEKTPQQVESSCCHKHG
jgi:sulfite exporter TauE/SafE